MENDNGRRTKFYTDRLTNAGTSITTHGFISFTNSRLLANSSSADEFIDNLNNLKRRIGDELGELKKDAKDLLLGDNPNTRWRRVYANGWDDTPENLQFFSHKKDKAQSSSASSKSEQPSVDIGHILEGHSSQGKRHLDGKDKSAPFPDDLTNDVSAFEKEIVDAFNSKEVQDQIKWRKKNVNGPIQLSAKIRDIEIFMWYNPKKNTITTIRRKDKN